MAEQRADTATLLTCAAEGSLRRSPNANEQLPIPLYYCNNSTIYSGSCGVAESLLSDFAQFGDFPISRILSASAAIPDEQATALAQIFFSDALTKGIGGIAWSRALEALEHSLELGASNARLANRSPTHHLDLAYGHYCAARIALAAGELERAQLHHRFSSSWREVFDPQTGYLKKGPYYEGKLTNYSFRLLHDMAGRIGLFGNEETFVAALDAFFGYIPSHDGAWSPVGCFQGLNNEPDMEAPYAYIYAGRHDRASEVVRAVLQYRFANSRGGLPGNNDSGALTSWYVWSAMGLFPVVGQDVFLIGSPICKRAAMEVGNARFSVEVKAPDRECIYVVAAKLNSEPLKRTYLTWDEIARGSTLELTMSRKPSAWGADTRPPSWAECPVPPSVTQGTCKS